MSGCVRGARAFRVIAAGVALIGLTGCADGLLPPITTTPAPTPTVQEPANIQYYPSDEPLRLAIEHFNRGHYGIAEKYFRDAVEKAPRDVTAWIGLAATYDRIARFDLADRAYSSAIALTGYTTAILNNQGYSYMLRGDYVTARKKFLLAYQREPNNPTIVNNLKLLDGSKRSVERPDAIAPVVPLQQ